MNERDCTPPGNGPAPRYNPTLFAVGICISLMGCLLVLGRLGLFDIKVFRLFWPLVLIVLGIVKLSERRLNDVGGWILLALGALFFAKALGGYSLSGLLGPAVMVIVGVSLVVKAVYGKRCTAPRPDEMSGNRRGGRYE